MKVKLNIISKDKNFKTEAAKFKKISNKIYKDFLDYFKFTSEAKLIELSALLTDDNEIKELNHKFRGKNKATNVLSFPNQVIKEGKISDLVIEEGYLYLGDIAFSLETMAKEAQLENKKLIDHYSHLMIHSLLHLIGFDHKKHEDAIQMQQLEIALLSRIGVKSPY